MHNCDSLDPLVTPFVDGALPDADRRAVEDHLRKCPPLASPNVLLNEMSDAEREAHVAAYKANGTTAA